MRLKMSYHLAYMLQKLFPDWYSQKGAMWDSFRPFIWNNKFLISEVKYKLQSNQPAKDVKSVFVDSTFVKLKANEICEKCKTDDQKIIAIFKWVTKNIKYVSDINQYKQNEYWATPEQTLMNSKGDCDDYGILIAQMGYYVGIPPYRLKVCAGYVKNPNGNGVVGHAYCIYLKEFTNEWYIIDGTYYTNKVISRFSRGVKAQECPEYIDIWFTFNIEYSWSQKKFLYEPYKLYNY